MSTTSASQQYRAASTVTPYVIRPGRSSLRTTYQLAADVAGSPEEAFAGAANTILDWLAAKFPQPLPAAARQFESFEADHHAQQHLTCIAIPEDGLWTVRLVQPDAPFRNRPAVAGRTWMTDLTLHRSNAGVRFGVRVLCASAPYATEPIALTRPRVVIDLAQRLGLREIRPIDGQPWMLESEDDLHGLHGLITDHRRTFPVIMLTQPDPRHYQLQMAEYMLNHELLARRTQGFAHVVCMPMQLGFTWTEMVGKVWSAFHGAVRTYQPNLDFMNDSPFAHPRILPDRILFWRYAGLEGEDAFASFLIDKVQEQAATKLVDWGKCLFFADARSRRATLTRERIRKEVEQQSHADEAASLRAQIEALEKAHSDEIEALNAKIEEAAKDVEEFDALASQYKQEAERSARDNRSLQSQNDMLRAAISEKTGRSADEAIPIPQDYADMADWIEYHLTGRLILHPRAIQGIKKAAYEDVPLVYQALLLLADAYRSMRLGNGDSKKAWEEGLKKLELRFGGSITKERAGEHGNTYFVQYPLGTNQRQFLEFHLRKGSTKDDRYCLGIYFFWDDDTQQVVVGWLPSHLDTRAT